MELELLSYTIMWVAVITILVVGLAIYGQLMKVYKIVKRAETLVTKIYTKHFGAKDEH